MNLTDKLKKEIEAASGECKASLVLKNANVINVFTNEIEHTDIAIEQGYIVGLGQYDGIEEIDLNGQIVCPGFIDGHIHLESSMVSPREFQQAVLPHGTTGVVADPHEIANVSGEAGIRYMMEATEKLALDVYFMMPSCVPATELDESGAVLNAEILKPYYSSKRVLGLAELMDSYGTVKADTEILKKLADPLSMQKAVDGHAPFISGKNLNAYITAGARSDHECSDISEAKEKLKRGQWIMIREGTAAKNMDALLELFQYPYCNRAMFVTDDKHPGDLIHLGHMDYIVRKAIEKGADPIISVKMASFNTAQCFGLRTRGAVAPGYKADLIVVSDLNSLAVEKVYKNGRLVAQNGKCLISESDYSGDKEIENQIFNSFHMKEITKNDLELPAAGNYQRVICLTPNELITTGKTVPFYEKEGVAAGVNINDDIIKLAVFERHRRTGHVGIGFLSGYGLKKGAVASSIAHDSHNLIIAGTNDEDMAMAGNRVRENKGGLVFVADGVVLGELPLPIAGLMSDLSVAEVEKTLDKLKAELKKYGISSNIDPFMTLAFVSLPVIPDFRLNTYGLIDVKLQRAVDSVF